MKHSESGTVPAPTSSKPEPDKGLNRPSLIHRLVAFGDIRQRDFKIEHPVRVDSTGENRVHRIRRDDVPAPPAEQAFRLEEQARPSLGTWGTPTTPSLPSGLALFIACIIVEALRRYFAASSP